MKPNRLTLAFTMSILFNIVMIVLTTSTLYLSHRALEVQARMKLYEENRLLRRQYETQLYRYCRIQERLYAACSNTLDSLVNKIGAANPTVATLQSYRLGIGGFDDTTDWP